MDPAVSQALGWLFTVVHVALCVALVVVALVRVRGASAAGGYLLAAAGGVDALGSCCTRGFSTWVRSEAQSGGYESMETMFTASSALSLLINLVAGILLVTGLVIAGRALSTKVAS